jgi:hypothetical protein
LIRVNALQRNVTDAWPVHQQEHAMRITSLVLSLAIGLATAPAFAQSADPAWLDDLSMQIEGQKQCKIAYLMKVQEGELGGQKTYEARVQCEDGRMFDAQRIGEADSFTFKACEIQVC